MDMRRIPACTIHYTTGSRPIFAFVINVLLFAESQVIRITSEVVLAVW